MKVFVVAGKEQSALPHCCGGDAALLKIERECITCDGRIAYFDFICGLHREAALILPIFAHGCGFFGLNELLVKPSRGEFMDFEDLLAQRHFFAGRATGFVFEGDVKLLSNELDGFREFEVLDLHDEGEAVAAFAGTEAFIEAAVGVDVKRRGLLLSKRAETFP